MSPHQVTVILIVEYSLVFLPELALCSHIMLIFGAQRYFEVSLKEYVIVRIRRLHVEY